MFLSDGDDDDDDDDGRDGIESFAISSAAHLVHIL
jgi:hypothetical protein